MSRTRFLVVALRVIFGCVFLTVCALVFGPFGGAESSFGFTDKEAHVAAFFVLTSLLLGSLPKVRRWDLAWVMVGFGGLIELIQGQIGRDCDLFDWIADCIGVTAVTIPFYFDRLRIQARGRVIKSMRRRRSDRRGERIASEAEAGAMAIQTVPRPFEQ